LQQNPQEGQITERFTRAVDQLDAVDKIGNEKYVSVIEKFHSVSAIERLNAFNLFIIGPLRMDVTSAMITKATNKRSLISPASLATVANIISIAPLAFKAKPMTADCLHGILLTRRPSITPNTLPIHATKRTTSTRTKSKDATKFACRPIETK